MIVHHQAAEMPGMVVRHLAEPGDQVATGEPVLVVETMKCEWPVATEVGGRLGWLAPVGTVVAVGEDVLRVEERAAVRPPSPDDIVELLCSGGEPSLAPFCDGARFVELDVVEACTGGDVLVPVPPGRPAEDRAAGVVVGRISHRLDPHEAPVERVWLCGDATRSLGAVAEPECRRILAAIDLAEAEGLVLEWVAVSAGARISMDSGTENMDWCAAVVRRLVEFTQAGGEVVLVVAGVNVGAQSYWNAEATMLMHCAGMLVMVEGTAMVLTGHRALAQAGGVSERSDHDLGGTGVMSANGQAHHRAGDLVEALALVLEHHALCASGDRHPAVRAVSTDRAGRDVCTDPYDPEDDPAMVIAHGAALTVGDVLHEATNPDRTRPFAIEPVMAALVDRDAPRLARWSDMEGASGAVVWDTRVDGRAVCMVGIDSRPRRVGAGWEAAGTLYPMAARKVARALNHASGRRPAVVLANLAGFDGSRSSLVDRQLEHGAELARAVVNFRGPLVVVVIGRFHGGAYVVLNRRLNPGVRIVALEGTRVSVIGGTAAAEVVLVRDVRRLAEEGAERSAAVRQVADRFDDTHDVGRARQVGSVDLVIDPSDMRPTVAGLLAPGGQGRDGRPDSGSDAGTESGLRSRSRVPRLAGTSAGPA